VNPRQLLIVFVLVGLALGVIILLLVTGGAPQGGFDKSDLADDVVVEGQEDPPTELQLADVLEADVRQDGTGVAFEATMATEIPERLKDGSGMQWRWEVIEGGKTTWILSANLDLGPNASLVSQTTNYGASTIDGKLPGRLAIDGNKIFIRLEPAAFAGFPGSFNWTLTTSLDADKSESSSALARDSAPDTGIGQYPPP
jgi:hypothetical protein